MITKHPQKKSMAGLIDEAYAEFWKVIKEKVKDGTVKRSADEFFNQKKIPPYLLWRLKRNTKESADSFFKDES